MRSGLCPTDASAKPWRQRRRITGAKPSRWTWCSSRRRAREACTGRSSATRPDRRDHLRPEGRRASSTSTGPDGEIYVSAGASQERGRGCAGVHGAPGAPAVRGPRRASPLSGSTTTTSSAFRRCARRGARVMERLGYDEDPGEHEVAAAGTQGSTASPGPHGTFVKSLRGEFRLKTAARGPRLPPKPPNSPPRARFASIHEAAGVRERAQIRAPRGRTVDRRSRGSVQRSRAEGRRARIGTFHAAGSDRTARRA